MPDELAIEVRGLVKRFRRQMLKSSYTTWKSLLLSPFRSPQPKEWVRVLEGIDFEVPRGRTLAIIGKNGSGKSTLLKILAGIYKPDAGQVRVEGRVSSLIELGAGFHPEFTGRENIFINGAILGLSRREIAERLEEIIAYSGLGEFIDAPVRTYSSGMYVRLGFAIAVNVDPDVLLVDEVLAVGDEAFSHKCEDKLIEFRRQGKTICLVTHDLTAVEKFADEVIWLHGGKIAARGEPLPVIDAYRQQVAREEDLVLKASEAARLKLERWGDGSVEITRVRMLDAQGRPKRVFMSGEAAAVEMDYQVRKPRERVVFGVAINTMGGLLCYGTNTRIDRVDWKDIPDTGRVRFECPRLELAQGSYKLDVAAHAPDGRAYDYIRGAIEFAVRSPVDDEGIYRPAHRWSIEPLEEGHDQRP